MKLTVGELAKAVDGIILNGDPSLTFENITTASNKTKGKDLFIPIIGEKTDGHLYISSAFENGAACSLTMEPEIVEELKKQYPDKGIIQVCSTVEALQEFARYFRKTYLDYPFIGVTGSVGKTSTREMICQALRAEKKVYSTKGNANSQVGVPITVFEADTDADLGVVELGISEFGEMQKLSGIPCVEIAVITNIGISHLAQFKTQENILREKIRIIADSPKGTVLLVNGDDPMLRTLNTEKLEELGISREKEIKILRFGFDSSCDFRAASITKKNGLPEFDFISGNNQWKVALTVPGDHMVMNATAALAVCELCGVDPEKAAAELQKFEGFEGRGKQICKNGYTIINDCYNASPVSMRSGLSVLSEMAAKGRKIAVLADMKELGEEERKHHTELGTFINESVIGLNILFTYGELAAMTGEEVRKADKVTVKEFQDFDELKNELSRTVHEGDILFLKGSWSMGLGRLIE